MAFNIIKKKYLSELKNKIPNARSSYYYLNRLFYYIFDVDDANPLNSPISTETGVITQIQDNANNNNIATSELYLGGSSGASQALQGGAVYGADANGDPFAHQAGLVAGWRWRAVDIALNDWLHLELSNSSNIAQGKYSWITDTGGGIYIRLITPQINVGVNIDGTGATTYETWIALSNDGKVLFYGDLEGNGYATLYWIADQQALSTIYNHMWGRQVDLYVKTAGVGLVDKTLFDPPYSYIGIVPVSTSGNAPDGDSTFEFVLDTLPSADAIWLHFRIQDATNYWRFGISSTKIQLREVVDGGSTTRSDLSIALTGGETIKIRCDGNEIKAYYDETLAWTYSSANNFLRETAWEVNSLGTGGQISDLRIYKTHARTESGLGSELVTDGDMSIDVSNWVSLNSPQTKEYVGGRLHVVASATPADQSGVQQNFTAIIGKYYLLTFDYEVISDTLEARIQAPGTVSIFLTGSGSASLYVQTGNTNPVIRFIDTNAGVGEFYIDNVSIKEIQFIPDTVNAKLESVIREIDSPASFDSGFSSGFEI